MKIYISADIEGVAGVVSPAQTQAGNSEYDRARHLMTKEVSAAVEGALAGGADGVLVNDAHGPMTNLLPEILHPAAELILGRPKPLNMFEGLRPDHAGVFCIGYHARARSFGVLAHTTNSFAFREVRIDGVAYGEAAIYGAYAGSIGVPVLLVTGDDQCVAENRVHFPDAEFVVVKTAIGNRAARNQPVPAAREAIREAAGRAVRRAGDIRPFRITEPRRLELEMAMPALADLVALLPPAERHDAVTVSLPVTSVSEVIHWMSAVSAMSAFLR